MMPSCPHCGSTDLSLGATGLDLCGRCGGFSPSLGATGLDLCGRCGGFSRNGLTLEQYATGQQIEPATIVKHLSVSDVAKWTQELVKAERASHDLWRTKGETEQRVIFMLIQASLCRLLQDPSWVSGSLHDSGVTNRLDVTFTVDVSPEARHRMEDILAEELRDTLSTMSEHLKVDGRGPRGELPPT